MELNKNKVFEEQLKRNSMQTYINRLQENDPIFDEIRYPTGFKELDKALSGGFVAGLHCIGAISSLGKTTFVLQMGENMAAQNIPVIIFSLEMRPEQLVAKSVSRNMYLSALEQQDSNLFYHTKSYTDLLSQRKRSVFTEAEQCLYAKSLLRTHLTTSGVVLVSETAEGQPFSVEDIVDFINAYISITKKKPVVIIDYLQFIRPGTFSGGTDKQMMDYIISMLVFTAKTQRIPIIAISSLNRTGYDSPVTMASFKESGFIEYSCETMLGLQLKGVGTKDFSLVAAKSKNPKELELVLIKGRGIEVGNVIEYRFYGKHNYFEEIGAPTKDKKEKRRVR